MIEMKRAIVLVPFFINKSNMSKVLSGRIISNFDEIKDMLFKHGSNIYLPRTTSEDSEYPSIKDVIVAKALRYIDANPRGNIIDPMLQLELHDSLYYHRLKNPCIKINGYAELDEAGYIEITKVTRLTLAEGFEERHKITPD